ncbi:MAG: c-type cytochrome [Isosphaeraceae bacterium]|nr:c-type cytochrome [Isosphaeraceae bacterium]
MKLPAAILAGALAGLSLAQGADVKAPVPPPPPAKAPAEALKALQVPDDLRLDQVLAEPIVAQPIFANFDERGRMWVAQYLQYPFPAGLKILSEDKFLRAVYDKVPLPPPHHVPGRDKITVHEDTDGDGVFDRHKTFLEGLNIATSFAQGRGGVWVLNPPYLLFYPDKNHDDVPDGDPEVHLEGFGLEDTHSCANNLQWGPDGWLYACQGSTVSGHVKHYGVNEPPVHSIGQLIWRYHPETRKYEIYAEGGGNAFGLEIDNKGRVYSGHNGGDTRGFHYVQGGYYQKGFGKHGSLSNPYTFGYFQAMKHPTVPRFTHAFVRYEDTALPERYRGNLLAVHPLGSHVVASALLPDRSSYQTKDIDKPITSTDPWFRPVNITVGPDGAAYVSDMYEIQIAHLRHHEGMVDRSNGRIYRLRSKETALAASKPFDLERLTTAELVDHLSHPNRWHRSAALRVLGDRKDREAIPLLLRRLDASTGQDALEALWGVNLSGGFNDAVALHTLGHADPYVRLWTVRLLGDAKQVSATIAARLAAMAEKETNLEARVQLACSARRLPAAEGLPIVRTLLTRDEDTGDIFQPLLLWWAIESWCDSDRDKVAALFDVPSLWRHSLVRDHLLHRVMRRYAQAGTRKDLATCARLLKQAPDAAAAKALVRGFEEAYQGRSLGGLPEDLTEALARFGGDSVPLGLRQNKPEAVTKALAVVANDSADSSERLQYVTIFGQVNQPRSVPVLLEVLQSTRDDNLRLATLTALQQYNEPKIGTTAIALYPRFSDDARSAAQTLLASRKAWAILLLEAVDRGAIDRASVPADVVRQLTAHRDDRIAQLVSKHWGNLQGATTADMKAQIDKLEGVVRTGNGSPYAGKVLFKNTCAKCHKLFDQGGQVGPDLTTYQRTDVANMLVNVVNPSAEIREGFETLAVATNDGRLLTGTLVEKDNQILVLRGADGQNVTIRQDQIDEMAPQKKSLMPEGLLKDLTEQQVRDLFAYLRSTQPLAD